MAEKRPCILGIDQSTQGTKAIVMAADGSLLAKAEKPHTQIISAQGWVSHDLDEIYENTLQVCHQAIELSGVDPAQIAAIGISNQRETTCLFDSQGFPKALAIVWQCSRAKEIASQLEEHAPLIQEPTGLQLSPFFPACKMRWLLDNTPELIMDESLHLGTIDSYLICRLSREKVFATDYSNASRTQLFNLHTLHWDKDICALFGIDPAWLPEVRSSNGFFGTTDLEGFLPAPIPIHGAAGDSHCALLAQGCLEPGQTKVTYGTGSSIMMNAGSSFTQSRHGLVTSLAWGLDDQVTYALEGNINYSGAVISWLKDDLGLIDDPAQSEELARQANSEDRTILVPAFSGLSAPYWRNEAKAILCNMTRQTGKKEIVKAALDSIVLQIEAVLSALAKDTGLPVDILHADGGASGNTYLMQRQSDLSHVEVRVSDIKELSALGAAFLAADGADIAPLDQLLCQSRYSQYQPQLSQLKRQERLQEWDQALASLH